MLLALVLVFCVSLNLDSQDYVSTLNGGHSLTIMSIHPRGNELLNVMNVVIDL